MMPRTLPGAVCLALLPCGMACSAPVASADAGAGRSIVYLQLLLRAHPGDDALRVMLARRLSDARRWAEARAVLAPLLERADAASNEVRLVALEMDCAEFASLTLEPGERRRLADPLQARAGAALPRLGTREDLLRLAAIGLALERPGLAAQVYQRLAAVDPQQAVHWLELAGQQQLANNRPGEGAALLEQASRAAPDAALARRLVLRAVDAWLANQDGRQALLLLRASARMLPGDAAFMRKSILVAMAQGDVVWARDVGRQLRLLEPDDLALMDSQLDRELAARDLNAALQLAQRLVRLQPDSVPQRTRLARLADWTGHPGLALQHWAWLCVTAPSPESLDRAMRVALALERDAQWLSLAGMASQRRALTGEELQGLSAIAQRQKVPGPLIAFLARYGQRHALAPEQWEALADAHAQLGQTGQALAIWQGAAASGATAASAAAHRARLLVLLERPGEALQLLQDSEADAAPDALDFWRTSADLEWQHGSAARAARAYLRVWSGGTGEAQVAERLISSLAEQGEPDQAVAVAYQAFERTGQARWLLLAMDVSARHQRWDLLRSSATRAQAVQQELRTSSMYWLLLAHAKAHDGQAEDATRAWQQASALHPSDVPSRLQLIWAMAADGLQQPLADNLERWEPEARQQAVYWPAYAMARLQLGQLPQSLDWLERMVRARPQDYRAQSDYLYRMRSADWSGLDAQARDAVLQRLTLALLAPRDPAGAERGDVLLALEDLVRGRYGPQAGDAVLQGMLDQGFSDARIYRRLVDSSLQQKDFAAAAGLLQAAQAQGQQLPAYQSLALAMETHDVPAMESLLRERGDEIAAADRISALRRMGHSVQALALADRALLDAPGDDADRLLQHRDALRQQLFSEVSASYLARDLAGLSLRSSAVSGSFANDAGRFRLRLAHNALGGDGEHLLAQGLHNEDDASVAADVRVAGDPVHLAAGGNLRTDQSVYYAGADWTHAWSARNSMRLDLALHMLSDLTPALRAVGMQDKLAFVLQHTLSDAMTARAGVAAQAFSQRNGAFLGQGYRAEAALEKRLQGAASAWTLRVSGSSDNNRLADALPPGLIGTVLPAGQTIEDVVPRHFSTVGAGARLQLGEQDAPRQAHGVLDMWAGQQWPAATAAYTVMAAASIPLNAAGSAQLRVDAHYTNVLGGVSAQSDRALGLTLQYRF